MGDVIVIRPGEKVPLDGQVVAGESYLNQAPVTGESLPVQKHVGDEVLAGTINGRGALEVEVTRRRPDTTLARVIHLVERAQAQRAPTQTFVERFAHYYTPAVMALAVGCAVVPPVLFAQPAGRLGVSSPCAAGHLLPLCPRDLDPCGRRLRPRGRRAQGRADQGREPSGADECGSVRRL